MDQNVVDPESTGEGRGSLSKTPGDEHVSLHRRGAPSSIRQLITLCVLYRAEYYSSLASALGLSFGLGGYPGFIPPPGSFEGPLISEVKTSPSQHLPVQMTFAVPSQATPKTSRGVVPTLWEVSASDGSPIQFF